MITRRRTLLSLAAALLLLLISYLLFWPVPFAANIWVAPQAPSLESGPFQRNTALVAAEVTPLEGAGPEDVAIDSDGNIYVGLLDGRILRSTHLGKNDFVLFANTEGRPLGLDFDTTGNLIVADAVRGLLSVDAKGKIRVLSTEHGGKPFVFTDDVDVGSNGRYYFSDASSKWDREHLREEFFEHRAYGRLLVYDPTTEQTHLLLDDLYFANGVAVANDASFVLVTETSEYRVRRVWLDTEGGAVKSDILIENLPGMPDGISAAADGTFWLALFSPRVGSLDSLLGRPWLRKLVYRLPSFLHPDPPRHGFVLGLDASGHVIANLQDPSEDSFSPITSAEAVGGWLYLGSISYPGLAKLPVPKIP